MKHFCRGFKCQKEVKEPEYCCEGQMCGCYGEPLEPPLCDEHYSQLKTKSYGEITDGTSLENGCKPVRV